VQGLYALYRLADRLEAPADATTGRGGQVRVALGEALGRVGDVVSGIPH
jgi:hypothetical protein